MNNTTPPPGDPVWGPIRLRYEQDQETVAQIAQEVGLSAIGLARLAKAWGWVLRGRIKPVPTDKARSKESTSSTIKRLKEVLQQRLSALEAGIKELGKDVNALETERQIRATNTLVRTMEKVIEIERKENVRKRKRLRDFKYFDDAQRQQLADKIERLQRQWRGEETVANSQDRGSSGAEQPVALLGEAEPAIATERN
jgi:hypothetical protein